MSPAGSGPGPSTAPLVRDLAYFQLKDELEQFLYDEAELLDSRDYDAWLARLADDLVYFMPQRRNVRFGTHAEAENTRQGEGISWFDEDRWTLTKRIEQIQTGVHYAEEPLSRVCHIVSNVQLVAVDPTPADAVAATVRSRFVVHQNRVEYETYTFIGRRLDVLRRAGGRADGAWQLARREILLDQSVLLAKNLTTFF
ncbi:MAG: 3-phenylpropionate/cinnamic acid dioxygenase subunit beta [Acidimicrobiia bacterium]|nr:3-phenylpropionate/cinnamic acid dioxygenase subunit beta [Acidimicrobiia bacterium]